MVTAENMKFSILGSNVAKSQIGPPDSQNKAGQSKRENQSTVPAQKHNVSQPVSLERKEFIQTIMNEIDRKAGQESQL